MNALFQGGTSHLLDLLGGGFSGAVLGVVLLGSMLSTGSGEGCHLLGLGDCLGAGAGGAAGAGCPYAGVVLGDKKNEWDVGACPNKTW